MTDIMGYKRVLVPYDGSTSAENALKTATSLKGVESIFVITVVPVYEGDLELFGVNNIQDTIKGSGEKILKNAEQVALSLGKEIETEVLYGVPYEQICAFAETNHINLIVMGRKGLSELERLFIGSVTQRVLWNTSKDILVVPPRTEPLLGGNVVVAYDGSSYSKRALDKAIVLVRESEARIVLVNVIFTYGKFFALPEEAVKELIKKANVLLDEARQRCVASNVACDTLVIEGEPHNGIVKVVDDVEARLVCIGSHSRSGLNKLLLGSVTEKVIAMSDVPVLVVKN